MYVKDYLGRITRTSDGAYIPIDEGNRDYREYLAWLDLGNVVLVASEAVAQIVQRIAARRYRAEVSGINLSGMPVDTDRDSQGLIAGAALAALIDPQYVVHWKAANGAFVELSATQVLGVASAVRAHVQACFNREAELLAAVAADTYSDAELEQGWPSGVTP